MKRFFSLLFCLLVFIVVGRAQTGNLFIRNFPPSVYRENPNMSSPQNWDIIQDARGVIYCANTTEVLEFDGTHWNPVTGTINMSDVRSFGKNKQGRIFFAGNFGGVPDLGCMAPDSGGLMQFVSLKNFLPKEDQDDPVLSTQCDEAGIEFITAKKVLTWNNENFSVHALHDSVIRSFCVGKKTVLRLQQQGLCYFNNGKLTPLLNAQSLNGLELIEIISLSNPDDSINWWLLTSKNGIFHFNGSRLTHINSGADSFFTSGGILSGLLLPDSLVAVGTQLNGIVIINRNAQIIDHINKAGGLYDEIVNGLYYDNNGGLWAALNHGLARIEYPSPLRYFDETNGIEGTVYSVLSSQNKLWAGGDYGLAVLDLKAPGKGWIKNETIGGTWSIREVDGDIFVCADNGLFVFHDGKMEKAGQDKAYEVCAAKQFPGKIYVAHADGISVWSKQGMQWKQEGKINGVNHEVRTMQEDDDGNLWAAYEKISFITFNKTFSLNPQVLLLSSKQGYDYDNMQELDVYKIKSHIYFGTFIGLYSWDASQHQLVHDSIFGQRFCNDSTEAFELTEDNSSGIWLTSEFRNGRLTKQSDHYVWDTIPLMRLSSVTVWSIYVDDQDIVWFGTDNGLFRYDQSIKKNYHVPYNTLIRSVTLNGTIPDFGGTYYDADFNVSTVQPAKLRPVLRYSRNDIAFEFSAPEFDSNERTQYSFWLEGKDKTWSNYSSSSKKEYTNLHEGNYTFHVKAKNFYGIEATEASYTFRIKPPMHRTWFAYIVYSLLIFFLIWLIIQLNYRRLIRSKRNLENKVNERTEEIKHQKEIIESEKQKVEQKSLELEQLLVDLKLAQRQLIQSEKMASVGQLTAGIAHEINNPINFVSANINPLKRNFDDLRSLITAYEKLIEKIGGADQLKSIRENLDITYAIEETEKLLEGIGEGSRRTAEIVKGLRNFSRFDLEEMREADINDGMASTLVLLQNKLQQQNIEVIKSFGDIPKVNCYPGQLNQVIMNLISNAIDAIGSNGKIFITTSLQNNQIRISIRDTGGGMTDEVKQKIFDPFFTTKEVGKGTGLGLSISYGIIEKHNGTIEVKSEIGKGTEFIISLPVKKAEG